MSTTTLVESPSCPCPEQASEINRLSNILTENNIKPSLLDLGAVVAFEAMVKRGEVKEAYVYLLKYVKKTAQQHGLC